MNEIISYSIPLTEFEQILRSIVKTELQSYIPAPPPQEQELLTTAEVCSLLKISKVSLHKWKKDGRIKFVRIGTRIRFYKSDVLNSLTAPKKYSRQ